MGLKDAAFEQSSPICHMAELCEILKKSDVPFAPILFLYTDGGPNHRLTYNFSDDPAISSGILTCGRTEGLTLHQYDWKIPML